MVNVLYASSCDFIYISSITMKREYKYYDEYLEQEITTIITDINEVSLDENFISLLPIYEDE